MRDGQARSDTHGTSGQDRGHSEFCVRRRQHEPADSKVDLKSNGFYSIFSVDRQFLPHVDFMGLFSFRLFVHIAFKFVVKYFFVMSTIRH